MLSFSGKTTPIHNVLAMNVASLRKVSFYKSLKCCICARAFFRAKHLGVVKPPPSQSGFSDRMVPNLNFSLLFVSSMSKGDKVKKIKPSTFQTTPSLALFSWERMINHVAPIHILTVEV